jgi:protein TonB
MKTNQAKVEYSFKLNTATLLIVLSFALMSFDTHHDDENDDQPVMNPSEKPEYCGGEKAMFEFLSRELEYPEIARVNGESGLVQIQFVVSKDGKIRDAKVLRPVNPWLDVEALRVAKMLDCFTPGTQDGSIVESFYVLPVRFALSK